LIVEDFWTLALSRVVIGLAAGAISTISFTLTGDYFQGPARTRALAWVGAAPSAGSVVSLLAGGVLVDYGGWHAVFALYLAAIPVMILAAWVIQEPVQPSLHEPGGGALPPRFYLLYMLAVSVALAGVLPGIQLPFLLVGEGLRSATVTALLITCTALSSTVAAAAYPTLRRYLSIGEVLALMLAAAAVTYFLLAFEAGLPMIVLALVICGVPSGLTIPHMAAIAMERTTNLSRSRAIGLIVGGVFLGYFLIPFVSEPIRSALGSHGMFGALGAILVGAAIAAGIGSRFVRSDGGRPVSSLKVSPPK
jgi:MFS family permease